MKEDSSVRVTSKAVFLTVFIDSVQISYSNSAEQSLCF